MLGLIKLIFCVVFDLFRSRATLEAEILVLWQQIIVLRRGRVGRLPFSASDRLVLGWVCGLFPNTRAGSPGVDQAVPRCRTKFAS
jgi:hypothetical protein